MISIHAPPRGATHYRRFSELYLLFQFTPLREGRPVPNLLQPLLRVISIHAPPRGATRSLSRCQRCNPDFNSRPSARGDQLAHNAISGFDISIHAPPRGATIAARSNFRLYFISIHAPPRGATVPMCYLLISYPFQFTPLREGRPLARPAFLPSIYFNSRPSARGDHEFFGVAVEDHVISIHAPPRGATQVPDERAELQRISIHAPPRGATGSGLLIVKVQISIHAPPRGATVLVFRVAGMSVFQFTPLREGRQTEVDLSDMSEEISIHAPPRGATGTAFRRAEHPEHFNSRPSARGDFVGFKGQGTRVYFNSRPSARGDPLGSFASILQRYFNSRPSARGDGKRYAISANLLFNPYKSAWLNNRATQFVEIILVIFHRIIV